MSILSTFSALSGFIPDFLKKEDVTQKLGQQVVGGIFPNLVDETLFMALMNAVRTENGAEGTALYRELVEFHKELDTKQKNRLRHILGTLELTEKFDPDHLVDKTTKKDGDVNEKFARVQIDYEFTADDPRVQFLTNLAQDLLDTNKGVTSEDRRKSVKGDLLALELILKRTPLEAIRRWSVVYAKRTVPRYIDKAIDTPYWTLIKHRLTWEEKAMSGGVIHVNRYAELLERWLAANPGKTESKAREDEDFHKNCLSAIERRAGEQERELERLKRTFLPPWAKMPLIIIGIMVAISAIVTSII